jgi:hypothetical protein
VPAAAVAQAARRISVCERTFADLPKRPRRRIIHAVRIIRRGALTAIELAAKTPCGVVDSFARNEHASWRQKIQIRN